jgi:glycosyltransferase involved in cell wall biosynthesis
VIETQTAECRGRPLRILWLTAYPPEAVRRRLGETSDGGAQSWTSSLLHHLALFDDVSVTVACMTSVDFGTLQQERVQYRGLTARESGLKGRRPLLGRWRLLEDWPPLRRAIVRIIQETSPDVIHIHGLESPLGLIARDTSVPCLVSLQGLLGSCQRVFFRGVSAPDVANLFLNRRVVMGGGELNGYLRMRAKAVREREMMSLHRYFIGRTEWDKAFVAVNAPSARYFHGEEIMRPIFYETTRVPANDDSRSVFTTSSAMIFKGTECLIEAFAALRKMGQRDVVLRVAGVPPDAEVGGIYRRRAKKFGVEAGIDWLGRLNERQLAQELSSASVYAHPSHIDNSPNSLVEAMLVGAPIVATHVGGIPSLLADGHEGLLCPAGDPLAMASRIDALLADRELARRLGSNARQRARLRNDPLRVVEQTLRTYRAVAGVE